MGDRQYRTTLPSQAGATNGYTRRGRLLRQLGQQGVCQRFSACIGESRSGSDEEEGRSLLLV
jgi:hypothetical protein